MHFLSRAGVFVFFAVLVSGVSAAQNPWVYDNIVVDGPATGITSAYEIPDFTAASIAYHHATPEKPELWFGFDAVYHDSITVRMGVPQLERYRMLRPVAAVVGPGLPVPASPLPFDLPAGYGAVLYDCAEKNVTTEKERFSGTTSWIFESENILLPGTGAYYLVGYVPGGGDGKFWMSLGEDRKFKFSSLFSVPRTIREIRAFYEQSEDRGTVFWGTFLAVILSAFLAVMAVSPV